MLHFQAGRPKQWINPRLHLANDRRDSPSIEPPNFAPRVPSATSPSHRGCEVRRRAHDDHLPEWKEFDRTNPIGDLLLHADTNA
jgi:hypothetical protein